MDIRCVLMDLDGSTLVSAKQLAPRLPELIAKRQDIHWVIATGRSYRTAFQTEFGMLLKGATPHVFDGGAVVADVKGSSLAAHSLTHYELERAIMFIKKCSPRFVFASLGIPLGFVYFPEGAPQEKLPLARRNTQSQQAFFTWLLEHDVRKITLSLGQQFPKLPGELNCFINGDRVDILPAGVSKATGVAEVLNWLNLPPRQAAFVFNDHNDLPVVHCPKLQGIGLIKVGTRLPEIKADISVADPVDVAAAIDELLIRSSSQVAGVMRK